MDTTVIIVIFIAAVAVSFYFDYRFRKKREARINSLLNDLMSQNFASFDQKIEDKETLRLIPPFNIDYMKLTEAIFQDNEEHVDQVFDSFSDKRLNSAQKASVYGNSIGYFISKNDVERIRICADHVKDIKNNEGMNQYIQLISEIFVDKNNDHLNSLLDKCEKDEGYDRYLDEFLIARIYENMNDTAKADEYRKKADADMAAYIKSNTKAES